MSGVLQNLTQFFQHLFSSNLNWDIFLVLGLVVLSLPYTIFLGRQKVFLILVSIYVALAVLAYTPIVGKVTEANDSQNKEIYFAVGFFVIFFLLIRGVLGRIFAEAYHITNWWAVFFLSFLQLGLITSIIFSFLSNKTLLHFSPFVRMVLLNEWSRFTWLFLPIFIMAALAKKEEDTF